MVASSRPTVGPGADEAVPRSVRRVLDVLEVVVERGETTLTAVAGATGLTPTTALRHLRALEARGYVRRDAHGRYSTGATLHRLALTALRRGPEVSLVEATQPHLDQLAASTGESSYLAVTSGADALYLATAESPRAIRHVGWVGRTVPLEGSAVGDALAGAVGPQVRTGAVEPDITAVAHGVVVDGATVAALCVVGPSHRLDRRAVARTGRALAAAAEALAAELERGSEVAS